MTDVNPGGPSVDPPVVSNEPPSPEYPLELISVHETALEVLAGRWGRGNARRKRLEAAGHNVDDVIAEVNNILK